MRRPGRSVRDRPTLRLLAHAMVFLALFGWAFAHFDAARLGISFHGDESLKIAMGRYFQHFFLDRNFADPAWAEDHDTLTQPPGFRYIVGAGLWLQGHDLERLNRPYNWEDQPAQNRREGRVPTPEVLMDARRVSALLAAGSIAMLYVVGTLLGTPLAGVVAALLAGASPYLPEHFARALAESSLAFFVLLGLALSMAAFRRARHRPGGFGAASALGVGVALGAALLTKLTAVLAAPALGFACLGAALGSGIAGERRSWWRPLAWGASALLLGWGLFVLLNPFLWPAPPQRTAALFSYRQFEMDRQMRNHPGDAIHSPVERLRLVLDRSLVRRTWASFTLRVPLDVPLTALGLAALGAVAWRDWRGSSDPRDGERRVGPAALFLLWSLAFLLGTVWGYRYDQARYVVPVFLLATVLTGLGVETLLRLAARAWGLGARGQGAGIRAGRRLVFGTRATAAHPGPPTPGP